MPILDQKQIASLSFEEKVSLIDDLWASLNCSEAGKSLNDAYNHMLGGRITECDKDLDQLITLDRVSRQLRLLLTSPWTSSGGAQDAA